MNNSTKGDTMKKLEKLIEGIRNGTGAQLTQDEILALTGKQAAALIHEHIKQGKNGYSCDGEGFRIWKIWRHYDRYDTPAYHRRGGILYNCDLTMWGDSVAVGSVDKPIN